MRRSRLGAALDRRRERRTWQQEQARAARRLRRERVSEQMPRLTWHAGLARPLGLSRWEVVATLGIGVAAGVGVMVGGLAPTGATGPDRVWALVAGVVVAAAGSRAGRVPLVIAAGAGAVGAWGWWSLAGVGAALLASGVVYERRGRIVGEGAMHAASAGLALQALARFPNWDGLPTGASEVVAAVAVGLVVVAGWWNSRRWVRITLAVGAVGAVVAVAAMGVSLWRIVDDGSYSVGTALATDGTLASLDDLAASAEDFTAAEAQLAGLQARVDAPVLAPLRYLPLAAQQVRAIDTTIDVGLDLAGRAGDGAALVEGAELRPGPGQVDVAAVRSLEAPLAEMATSLQAAQAELAKVNSRWLVGPVRNATQGLAAATADALPTTELALLGVQTVPGMLGADGPRRWLIQLIDAENGTEEWQVVVADNGRLIPTEEKGGGESGQQAMGRSASRASGANDLMSLETLLPPEDFAESSGSEVDGILRLSLAEAAAIGRVEAPASDSSTLSLGAVLLRLVSSQVPSPQSIAEATSSANAPQTIRAWSRIENEQRLFRALALHEGSLMDDSTIAPPAPPRVESDFGDSASGRCSPDVFQTFLLGQVEGGTFRVDGITCLGMRATVFLVGSAGQRFVALLENQPGGWRLEALSLEELVRPSDIQDWMRNQ